jgi:hypothetical protein
MVIREATDARVVLVSQPVLPGQLPFAIGLGLVGVALGAFLATTDAPTFIWFVPGLLAVAPVLAVAVPSYRIVLDAEANRAEVIRRQYWADDRREVPLSDVRRAEFREERDADGLRFYRFYLTLRSGEDLPLAWVRQAARRERVLAAVGRVLGPAAGGNR